MNLKVAVLQMHSVRNNIGKNVQTIIDKIKEASKNNDDILLLPECFITGYDLTIAYEDALEDDNIDIKEICNVAKEYSLGVAATAISRGEIKPQNTALVIDKNGECVDNTILLADDMTEGLYFADFDMDIISEYRQHEMMENTFSKVKAYEELLNAEIKPPFIRN
ncbi:MAG: carbon-nitrogen hydrolase family protein [Clostridium sp.]|uniref:carbon-nitrogen hydrolase family protein n=1 Tax=Clostridium sp. TaxID=1506 RepID=UPI003074291F